MPTSLTEFRVFMASPGGLGEERQAFRDTLQRWSARFAEPRGVTFRPVGWEETLVGVGRPQELINEDLRQCDYAVFVLHDRWGSPTGSSYTSGVEEEWALTEALYTANKIRDIALFFKTVEPRQLRDPGNQLTAVLAFKRQIGEGKRYLYREYDDIEQFREALEGNLARWLRNASPELDAVPRQVPQAYVFGGDENDSIGLIDPPGDGLFDDPDQRQSYDDIRQKAENIITACGASNRLVGLKGYASKLLQTMGQSLKELRVRAFWAQMNSLRRRLEADDQIQGADDPEDPPLPPVILGQLRDLVDTLNIFAAHEPKLVELDELRPDPASRIASPKVLTAARQLSESAARATSIVSKEAANSLLDAAAETSGDAGGPASERAKRFFVRSARNLALELIRRAYKGVLGELSSITKGTREGAYRMIGATSASYALAQLIKSNEVMLKSLISSLGGSATLNHVIDLIVHSLK